MSRRCRLVVALLVYVAVATLPAKALGRQAAIERDLDGARTLYTEGRLDEAVAALRKVITALNQLRDQQTRRVQLADAHFHLGLSYFALRDESSALENFRQVVVLDPKRNLDPEIYSPKVINLFAQARADVRPAVGDTGRERSEPEGSSAGLRLGTHVLLPGTKVRLWLDRDGDTVKGNLVALNERSFSVVSGDNQNLSFPRDTIARIDVVKERHRHWLAGMIIGTAFGAAVGAAETPGCGGNDGDCYTRGENIGYGALGFGLVGALVGALIQTEEWVEIPFERGPRLVMTTVPRGLAVSFVWRY